MGTADDALRLEVETLRQRLAELEHAEAQREPSEDMLLLSQFTIELGTIPTFWIGPDARIIRVNDAACRLLGYSREELTGTAVYEFDVAFPEDQWAGHWEELKRRGNVSFESRHRTKDGTFFPVEIIANYLEFRGREYNVAFVRDVTERKRAEEALREREARYRDLFDHVPVGLYRTTPSGTISTANPALVRMLGYPDVQSLLKVNVRSLYVESHDRELLLGQIDRNGVGLDVEFQLRRYDGSRIWVREYVRAIRDAQGNVMCYEGSLEDVTKRKRAEEALRQERDFTTTLLQASPTFFVAISATGRTLMMNQAMLTALGYSSEEVDGKDYLETFVPEADRDFLADIFEKLVHRKEPTLNENRVVSKDGRELLVEWHGRPIFKENGELDFFFGVGIDVTERRKVERQRAEVEAQLRHAHKMQAVGQLAAGVAHDFNSILTVILGNAEHILRKWRQTRLDEADETILRRIMESVDRGSAIVQRLLTFGRANTGKPRRLDLNQVVAEVEKMLRPLIVEDIEVEVIPGSGVQPIFADPGQIEEAVMNLMLNARDAMPQGGRLTVQTGQVPCSEMSAAEPNTVEAKSFAVLTVSDTGIGMNEDIKQRLFEPFFTTKPIDKGTGLGLSIVHGIVTQLGGHIAVDSEPGKGTTFKLYFPTAYELVH